jgi:hypothetical protein
MFASTTDTEIASREEGSFFASAKRICIEWEKLRILYNGALIAWVVYLVEANQPALFETFAFWITCIVGAIVANVCFFAGPLAETYFHWIGFKHWSIRWAMLLIGTQLAALLATGTLMGVI